MKKKVINFTSKLKKKKDKKESDDRKKIINRISKSAEKLKW